MKTPEKIIPYDIYFLIYDQMVILTDFSFLILSTELNVSVVPYTLSAL